MKTLAETPYIPLGLLVLLAIILVIYLIAFLQGREISFYPPKIGARPVPPAQATIEASEIPADQPDIFLKHGYPRSQHPQFFAEVERLVPTARDICLIATGLNLIWEKHILDLLLQRAQSGRATVVICLGNPYSPQIENRLIEEEMGDNRPPVGKEGIRKNIEALVDRLDRAGNPPNFSVLLFEHYPTFATLIFDKEVFIYPYAYQIVGNTSPIFHMRDDGNEEVGFFRTNARRIVHDAIPARQVVARRRNQAHHETDWIGAAVYLIPRASDPFYRFGSDVLGYDIRSGALIKESSFSDLAECIGQAQAFGFHATLADALYFASEAELERVEAELRLLTLDFHSFTLSNLQVVDRADAGGDIVVAAEDDSGTTEALHHELVSRVYRMAISSNYLTGQTNRPVPWKNKRDTLMTKRYGAPFILSKFQLHFTLCSRVPGDPEIRRSVVERLKAGLAKTDQDEVEIGELVLVGRNQGQDRWTIRDTFILPKA